MNLSIDETVAALRAELAGRTWTDRYRWLIAQGRALDPLTDDERSEANLVSGCLSRAWLVQDASETGTLAFRAGSESQIVRGLVALAMHIYNGRTPAEVRAHDPAETFVELGLDVHVTRSRRDGFRALLARMQALSTDD